jgi:hypothetical protein
MTESTTNITVITTEVQPSVSDLTEQTTTINMMEETVKQEKAAPESTKCIPKTIEIIKPTTNWLKFARSPEPRTRIGVEIVLDGSPKPKKGQKKHDILKQCENNPPEYHHI